MNTSIISWGKGGQCVRLTTYHHPVPLSRNLGVFNFLEPSGPVQACNGTALPLPIVGIHRLLHSSCCFPNTNTAITRQLIRTARTLEAEWWQVCGEAWVRGYRKMRLGCWISPCYGPFSLGARFGTYEPSISLIFKFFSGRGNRGYWTSGYEGRLYLTM
jgi:hypothetical protein